MLWWPHVLQISKFIHILDRKYHISIFSTYNITYYKVINFIFIHNLKISSKFIFYSNLKFSLLSFLAKFFFNLKFNLLSFLAKLFFLALTQLSTSLHYSPTWQGTPSLAEKGKQLPPLSLSWSLLFHFLALVARIERDEFAANLVWNCEANLTVRYGKLSIFSKIIVFLLRKFGCLVLECAIRTCKLITPMHFQVCTDWHKF